MTDKIQFASKLSHRLCTMLFLCVIAVSPALNAQTYTVLHRFSGTAGDGDGPLGDLITDGHGNYFGVTYQGGNYNQTCSCGVVYELSPVSGGGWSVTDIYKFNGEPDGSAPQAGLAIDGNGNLYGTTTSGGQYDGGTVFELTQTSPGAWHETILYSFGDGADGGSPGGSLAIDANGNIFGTTSQAGSGSRGTVFELSQTSPGVWTIATLYAFTGHADGSTPAAGLTLDASGNIFGTALDGGNTAKQCIIGQFDGCGVVFELSPSAGGWTYNVIHTFNGYNGALPRGTLLLKDGNLYGTTSSGGNVKYFGYGGFGVVFELSPSAGGWTETVLHIFGEKAAPGNTFIDGSSPYSGVVFDAAGNLYGTTMHGGTGYGNVYKVSPTSGGWKESLVHAFSNANQAGDLRGLYPQGGVIFDSNGNMFGTTEGGGRGAGVLFEIAAPAPAQK